MENIKDKINEAKQMMKLHKHTIGYLGSQYYYWENEYNKYKQWKQ